MASPSQASPGFAEADTHQPPPATIMTRLLAWYHGITRAAAAACFVAVALFILYQLGGQLFPYVPRSADEFAGYCMGAAAFLGLADALRSGDHIRVTLLGARLSAAGRRALDWIALALGGGLAAWVAWYITRLAWDSWVMDERSSGLIALPMWIPQAAMAWGAIAFVVAILELAARMRAGEPMPGGGEAEETATFDDASVQAGAVAGMQPEAQARDDRR
jgi:TRAP-type C4-dicarboxylate transport system permease small subunit